MEPCGSRNRPSTRTCACAGGARTRSAPARATLIRLSRTAFFISHLRAAYTRHASGKRNGGASAIALKGKDLVSRPASGLSARKVRMGRFDDGPEKPALPELAGRPTAFPRPKRIVAADVRRP